VEPLAISIVPDNLTLGGGFGISKCVRQNSSCHNASGGEDEGKVLCCRERHHVNVLGVHRIFMATERTGG